VGNPENGCVGPGKFRKFLRPLNILVGGRTVDLHVSVLTRCGRQKNHSLDMINRTLLIQFPSSSFDLFIMASRGASPEAWANFLGAHIAIL
jgi:hypothetical protein